MFLDVFRWKIDGRPAIVHCTKENHFDLMEVQCHKRRHAQDRSYSSMLRQFAGVLFGRVLMLFVWSSHAQFWWSACV